MPDLTGELGRLIAPSFEECPNLGSAKSSLYPALLTFGLDPLEYIVLQLLEFLNGVGTYHARESYASSSQWVLVCVGEGPYQVLARTGSTDCCTCLIRERNSTTRASQERSKKFSFAAVVQRIWCAIGLPKMPLESHSLRL